MSYSIFIDNFMEDLLHIFRWTYISKSNKLEMIYSTPVIGQHGCLCFLSQLKLINIKEGSWEKKPI